MVAVPLPPRPSLAVNVNASGPRKPASGVYVAMLPAIVTAPWLGGCAVKVIGSLSSAVAMSVNHFTVFCVTGTNLSDATGERFPGTETFVVAMTVFGLLGVQSAFTGPMPLTSTLAMM